MVGWWTWTSDAWSPEKGFRGGRPGQHFVKNTAFSLLLKAAKADQQNYPIKKHYQWLREKGKALAGGQKTHLATIVNIDDSHWVAVIINSQNKQIYFGDSFRRTIPNDLKQVFNWWLGYHMSCAPFSYQPLPVSTQSDTYSSYSCYTTCTCDDKGLEACQTSFRLFVFFVTNFFHIVIYFCVWSLHHSDDISRDWDLQRKAEFFFMFFFFFIHFLHYKK